MLSWARFAFLAVGLALTACPQNNDPPAKPANFTVLEYKSDMVKLGWQAVTGAASYRLERHANGEAFKLIGSSTKAEYQDTTVQSNSGYWYRLSAVNAAGVVGAGVETSVQTPQGVNAVSLTTSTTAIQTGDTATLTFAVVGTGDFSPNVTWNINPADAGGTLTPGDTTASFTSSKPGTFKITAASVQSPSRFASVTIVVTDAPPGQCVVSGVTVQPDAASISPNQPVNLSATLNGTGACNTDMTWSLSPATGTLTSKGNTASFVSGTLGTYTITATSKQDPSKSGSSTIKVEPPTSVTVRSQYPMIVRSQSVPLSATVKGLGSLDQRVTWTVNPIDNTTLTPNGGSATFSSSANGAYTITATSVFDPSKSVTTIINVVDPITNGANAATMGGWSPVKQWKSVPISAALLSDGTVITWDTGDQPNQHTKIYIWNPLTDPNADKAITLPDSPDVDANLFCSGMTSLPNGLLFTAGGHLTKNDEGIKTTLTLNPSSQSWTKLEDMHQARWYPTVATMPDGQILAVSGSQYVQNDVVTIADLPEIFTGTGWRQLTGASLSLPYYPWMYPLPNGKVLTAGPQQDFSTLDLSGNGTWTTNQTPRDGIVRDYGASVMYRPNRVIVMGGGSGSVTDTTDPTPSTRLIDLETGSNTAGTPMNFGRRQLSATMLPNGDMLVTGGSSKKGFSNVDGSVKTPEIWNPTTGVFTKMADMKTSRLYHSTALLLPDGRVFSGGGWDYDAPRTTASLVPHSDMEFYLPPYLFKNDGSGQLAPRPVIDGAPASAGFGASFTLSTQDAASIQHVTLTRLGNSTHSSNFDQRYLELPFTASGDGLGVTLPAVSNVFIPGVYMLFVINDQGVPSVAKIIKINN
jgi:hypothetical protein